MEKSYDPVRSPLQDPKLVKLKAYLINAVAREFNQESTSAAERTTLIKEALNKVYTQTGVTLPESIRAELFHDILDDMIGYGPIQGLLEDPEITEVMVNRPNRVYIEREGKLLETHVKFDSDNHIMQIIERIVSPLGRRVDSDSPMVDARLPDGSRVNAVIPPVAIDGPVLTVRKFSKTKLTIDQLIEFDTLTPTMAEFLRACVLGRLNIVISGGTGSGKTTLLKIGRAHV